MKQPSTISALATALVFAAIIAAPAYVHDGGNGWLVPAGVEVHEGRSGKGLMIDIGGMKEEALGRGGIAAGVVAVVAITFPAQYAGQEAYGLEMTPAPSQIVRE